MISKVIYDPLGKYYGGFLYGAIGLTILSLGPMANGVKAALLTGITIVSLVSRLAYLIKNTPIKNHDKKGTA
jgi:hypothetical protein